MGAMPTDAMCFKEGTDTAQDAMAWYKRIVMGVALNGPTSWRYADALNGGRLERLERKRFRVCCRSNN